MDYFTYYIYPMGHDWAQEMGRGYSNIMKIDAAWYIHRLQKYDLKLDIAFGAVQPKFEIEK